MPNSIRVPRLLLTNDDGIDAPGLKALIQIAQDIAEEVWVIAPEHDQSGTGQSISLHQPLRGWPRGERSWAIDGTPADCVAMAVSHFMAKARPSFILSGINAGANVGDEINLSGTLGAAFTGLMLNIPSIAISQAYGTSRQDIRWDTAQAIAPKLLRYFLTHAWHKDTCLSINIPDCDANLIKGFRWARSAINNIANIHIDERDDHREQKYFWLTLERRDHEPDNNSDAAILENNQVAVTCLGSNRSITVDEPWHPFEDNS